MCTRANDHTHYGVGFFESEALSGYRSLIPQSTQKVIAKLWSAIMATFFIAL